MIVYLWVINMDIENKILKLENDNNSLQMQVKTRDSADKEIIRRAKIQTVVVEKKVEQIKKIYIPQIEYVIRYKENKNASNCENANAMLNSVVY